MSNVYNKKFIIFYSYFDKGKMIYLLQIYGKNKKGIDNYFLMNN